MNMEIIYQLELPSFCRVVREKSTGIEFACKSVSKTLNIPNLAPDKQAQHITNIEREIKILKKLRGTLSVVHFKAAYEDDTDIHMVMEYCRGGELDHQVGRRVYTEEMVSVLLLYIQALIVFPRYAICFWN